MTNETKAPTALKGWDKYMSTVFDAGAEGGKGNFQACWVKAMNAYSMASFKGVVPVIDANGDPLKATKVAEMVNEEFRRGQASTLGKDYSDLKTANSLASNTSKTALFGKLGSVARDHGVNDPSVFLARVVRVRATMASKGDKVQSVQNALCTAIRRQIADDVRVEFDDSVLEGIVRQGDAKVPEVDKLLNGVIKLLAGLTSGTHKAVKTSGPLDEPLLIEAQAKIEEVVSKFADAKKAADFRRREAELARERAELGIE